MSQDDRFSLDNLFGLPAQVPTILPASGLVCPKCGYEPKLQPDGTPTDSGWWSDPRTGQRDGPIYHVKCIGEVLMERDFAYIKEHLEPWQPKEEEKEVSDGDSSPGQ